MIILIALLALSAIIWSLTMDKMTELSKAERMQNETIVSDPESLTLYRKYVEQQLDRQGSIDPVILSRIASVCNELDFALALKDVDCGNKGAGSLRDIKTKRTVSPGGRSKADTSDFIYYDSDYHSSGCSTTHVDTLSSHDCGGYDCGCD